MERTDAELRRISEALFGADGLVVKVSTNERRIRDDLLPAVAELQRGRRMQDRENETLERQVRAATERFDLHIAAIGHGVDPVVIDANVAAAILRHLADERRHAEQRRSALRMFGWALGPAVELAIKLLTIALLAYVAARMGVPALPHLP